MRNRDVNEIWKKLLLALGINRAVTYGVLSRVWGSIAGPITILLIATRFSNEQQGFYYTILSLLALQIFFELGLMGVISTFVSHEFIKLQWGELGDVIGEQKALNRFYELLGKTTRWYGIISILLIVVLTPAGLLFLGQNHQPGADFSWRIPWLFTVIGTAVNLCATPLLATINGSGDVATINRRQMIGAFIGSCLSWVVIVAGGGLYSLFAVMFGNILSTWQYLFSQKPRLLIRAYQHAFSFKHELVENGNISWRYEIWPVQWKIALSWFSGYFIFQLFNPVLFHYYGAAVAGKMGITLSLSNAILGVCLTWINARNPEICKLIALRKWLELDNTFKRIMMQCLGISVVGALIGWFVIYFFQAHYQLGHRFIPAFQAAFLMASVVIHAAVYGFASYLRAHKQEPLMLISVFAALIQGIATWYFGKNYGSLGITESFYFISTFLLLPSVCFIWLRSRRAWH
jgi:hypothetical protein